MIFFEDGSFFIGHEHAWSDWPLHIAISNIFAYQPVDQWLPLFLAEKDSEKIIEASIGVAHQGDPSLQSQILGKMII